MLFFYSNDELFRKVITRKLSLSVDDSMTYVINAKLKLFPSHFSLVYLDFK